MAIKLACGEIYAILDSLDDVLLTVGNYSSKQKNKWKN